MKTIILFILISSLALAKINMVVSIVPQEYFAKKIGGDKVNISTIVLAGDSPHTYEPKPSQMKNIVKADVYFKIGIEFEHVWLDRFQSINNKMKIIDSAIGIKKIPIAEHNHEQEGHNHAEDKFDPHIWLSVKNAQIIAKNFLDTFVILDKDNQAYYRMNYKKFMNELNILDKKIHDLLLATDDMAKFLVFHPSWGYFAKEYRLTQVAIESGGKKPKAKHIQNIIKETKKDYYRVIITAPEFSDATAKIISKESGIKVRKFSPLAKNWETNLINFAKAIAHE